MALYHSLSVRDWLALSINAIECSTAIMFLSLVDADKVRSN